MFAITHPIFQEFEDTTLSRFSTEAAIPQKSACSLRALIPHVVPDEDFKVRDDQTERPAAIEHLESVRQRLPACFEGEML